MPYRKISFVAFPLLLIVMIALERAASHLLILYPDNWQLWLASVELRSIFRFPANLLDAATGFSISAQALILIGALIAALVALRICRPALSFLINHACLLAILAAISIEGLPSVAGIGPEGWLGDATRFGLALELTALKISILAVGVAGCILCHQSILRQARHRRRIRQRLQELSFDS